LRKQPLTQQPLAQQTVPQIPFDSVPNFFKLPVDLYMVKRLASRSIPRAHLRLPSRRIESWAGLCQYGCAIVGIRLRRPVYSRDWQELYAWSFAHYVRIDKDDNIWAVDKGSDMIIRFNPRAASRW